MLAVEADGDDTLHNRILTDLNLVDIRHCLSGGDARGGWDATSYLHSSGPATVARGARRDPLQRTPPIRSRFVRIRGMDHAEASTVCLVVA